MNFHVYLHADPSLKHLLEKIMALLDTLTADVAALTTVDQSAITLINGLAQQIKNAGTDPVALKALTDQIEANTASLSAAVTANTTAPPAA